MTWLGFVAVFIGGGLGAGCRYGLNTLLPQPDWMPFFLATLMANIVGGAAAGLLYAWAGPDWLRATGWGLFLMTGFLGGLTTFSAFTSEGYQLLHPNPLMFVLHAGVHVLASLGAFALVGKLTSMTLGQGS